MAIDTDINAVQDFNTYSPEELANLQTSALGESLRGTNQNTEFAVLAIIILVVIVAVIGAAYMLTKKSKN